MLVSPVLIHYYFFMCAWMLVIPVLVSPVHGCTGAKAH
jgi:hypothetical protein